MKRKTRSITIDPEIWGVIEAQASDENISVNRWVENYFLKHMKKEGLVSKDKKSLGEMRGGKR